MTDSGSTVSEVMFNIDVDLQIANMESIVDGQGPYRSLRDYKGVRAVFIFSSKQVGWILELFMQPSVFLNRGLIDRLSTTG